MKYYRNRPVLIALLGLLLLAAVRVSLGRAGASHCQRFRIRIRISG